MPSVYKIKCLARFTYRLVLGPIPLQHLSLHTKNMRRFTVPSLAFILAFSSTVAIAAPRAAVSPVPRAAAVNVPETPLNIGSASCKIHGACSSLSPPGTCCGACILINTAVVSQDTCSQQVLTPQHILINFLFT